MEYFSISPNLLPKSDKRYIKTRESLKSRPAPWNKGFTKKTHPSVLKTSKTFKRKGLDNFKIWRDKQILNGIIRNKYPAFSKNGDLAELIGVILGDGNIGKFPRSEVLTITASSNNQGFIKRYARLVKNIFEKKNIYIKKVGKKGGGTVIRIYQKNISSRLRIPSGARGNLDISIPDWIWNNKNFLKRYLRGLYEAEGSACIHELTYTYKLFFSNKNESLLNNVYRGMEKLGFHPHKSKYNIQISRKIEVFEAINMLKFRNY